MSTPQTSATPQNARPMAIAVIVFVLAAMASGAVVWTLEQRNMASQRMRIEAMASDHAHDIQTTMERALSATYSIAAMVRQGKGNVPDFEGVAAEILPWYPGVAIL